MIVQFEMGHIKTVYANLIEKGKISLIVEDPDNNQKTLRVFVHTSPPEMLRKFVLLFEEY